MSVRTLVSIVASAGGLSAVGTVLRALPRDLDAGVLVVVHQEPGRESRLPALLGDQTALTVEPAGHGDDLRPGHVLVAPPGQHVLVTTERRVALLGAGPFPPNRPSADLLLVSMALCLGRDAIAVVLSGGGHDGATGAVAVHDFGGRVLVSDEATSTHPSMPLATLAREGSHADAVPLDRMASRIVDLVNGT